MVTFLKDNPEEEARRAEDLSEPGFDYEDIGKSEMLQRIRDRAWAIGKKLDKEEEEKIFLRLFKKNVADIEAG